MIEDHCPASRRIKAATPVERCASILDFSFGFPFNPALCCICEGFPEPSPADKPPGCASVKGQVPTLRCDTVALENLNRLDYISRVLVSGVKADRP